MVRLDQKYFMFFAASFALCSNMQKDSLYILMYLAAIYFFSSFFDHVHLHSTWLKECGAFPVAAVTGVLPVCAIQSFSLQAVIKQLLLWLSIRPARYHFPINKKRKHRCLQEPGQEAQVGIGLSWEEGTLKPQVNMLSRDFLITIKSTQKSGLNICGNNRSKHNICALISITTLSKLNVPSLLLSHESKSRALWMTNSSYLPNMAAKRPANTSLIWIFSFADFNSSSSSSNSPSVFPQSDIFPPPHLCARACSLSRTASSSPARFPFLLSSIRSSNTRLLRRGEVVVDLVITPPCGGSPKRSRMSLSSWTSSAWSGNAGRSSGVSTQWLSMSTKHRLACTWDKQHFLTGVSIRYS